MHKEDLALNNLRELIYHKTKPNQPNNSKTEYMCYNPTGDITTLDETSL